MAGMRALGRVYDVVPGTGLAQTITVATMDCSGIGVVLQTIQSSAGSVTVYGCTEFTGGTSTLWESTQSFGLPGTYYHRAVAATGNWVAASTSWASGVLSLTATSGTISYVDFLVSEFADTYDYISLVAGASTYMTAILYDLTVQRTPANLRIPSA